MQIVLFALIALTAIVLNLMTTQGFFNVSDKLFWKQTTNLLSQRQPIKIDIKSINIESSIERVGVDANGIMEAPSSSKIVSWYQFGGLPGEKGNVVLSGHKDSALGLGVFYTLENIKTNTPIKITDAQKNTFTYNVTSVQSTLSEDLPVREIFSDQKKGKYLYLITCAGKFDFFLKKYDKRVLVKAELN